jgi:hypothetical protein
MRMKPVFVISLKRLFGQPIIYVHIIDVNFKVSLTKKISFLNHAKIMPNFTTQPPLINSDS